jgi:hypothetical protein
MMSRVEDIDPLQVKIGMRVKVRIHPGDEKQPPYPVFTPILTPDPSPPSPPPLSRVERGGSKFPSPAGGRAWDGGWERGASSSPSPLGRRGRDEGRGGGK